MQTELFMYFCIKNYVGTQGEGLSTVKVLLNDRSKAVVIL